jgi:phospholipid/cholesterol/gamma-HCH transport system permease protein
VRPLDLVARLGRAFLSVARGTGQLALVLARTLLRVRQMRRDEFWRGLSSFGFDSLPLTVAVAVLAGITVVVQTTIYVERFGARAMIGWAAGYSVLWEFGPLFLGLMLAARAGARNAAELATLTVGGRIEGLRGVSLDPFALLIAPRVLALALSVALLAATAFLVAILCEGITAVALLDLPQRVFAENLAARITWRDLLAGEVKSAVFGAAIALVSTAVGLAAQGGARAVGQAASRAVVMSCGAIFGLDWVLTTVLTKVLR